MLHSALVSMSNGLLELDLRSPSIARSLARSLARSSLARSLDRSVARTLGRSIARSLGRSVARSLGRSVARSLVRSVARSLDRSLDRSIARSLDRSIGRSLDRSIDRSIAWTECRLKNSTLGSFEISMLCIKLLLHIRIGHMSDLLFSEQGVVSIDNTGDGFCISNSSSSRMTCDLLCMGCKSHCLL